MTVGPRSFGSMLWGKTGLQAIHPAVSRQPFAGETPGLMVVEPPFVLAHMLYDPFSAAILTEYTAPQRELARRMARRVGRARYADASPAVEQLHVPRVFLPSTVS